MADERVERAAAAGRRSKELAARLADTADEVAAAFDRAADMHDAIAADERHPLRAGAAEHARLERRMAAHERDEASRIRRTFEDADEVPGAAPVEHAEENQDDLDDLDD